MLKFDIIIPYNNMTNTLIMQLYNTLYQQTIINNCHIIFISDDSHNETEILNMFQNERFVNITFLSLPSRAGFGAARNLGLQYCKAEYILFLDSNYYFKEKNSLEQLYAKLNDSKADVLFHKAYCNINNFYNMQIVIKQQYLNNLNIQFPTIFIGESLIFQAIIEDQSTNKNIIYDINQYYVHDLKNNCSIINEISDDEINLCLSIAYLFLSQFLNNKQRAQQFLNKFNNICIDSRIKCITKESLQSLIKQYYNNIYVYPSILFLILYEQNEEYNEYFI